MPKQSAVWARTEANAWHERNIAKVEKNLNADKVIAALAAYGIKPKTVFEVGCGTGARLARMKETMGCDVWGCDLSTVALASGALKYNIKIGWREAKNLRGIPTEGFDVVIYGFCLYATDPEDLFLIAREGDRILKDGGHMVVYDFLPDYPHSRKYAHNPSIRTHKMDYAKLWLWHPYYSLAGIVTSAHEVGEEIDENNRVSVTILKKDTKNAFPLVED